MLKNISVDVRAFRFYHFPAGHRSPGESRCRFPFASPAGDANFREIRHVNADGFPQVFFRFFFQFFRESQLGRHTSQHVATCGKQLTAQKTGVRL